MIVGDRAEILFNDGFTDEAVITLHTAGSDFPQLWARFCEAEDGNPRHDNRYDDAGYLAARFVVFLDHWLGGRGTGVGVGNPGHRYDGRRYRVLCTTENWPRVEPLDS